MTQTSSNNSSETGELPKSYKPSEHEERVWSQWMDAKAFHSDPQRVLEGHALPYCVFIPPPNVTAALHLGHALNNTIQDILVRAHRMRGFEALWMPGTDHAGIATQAVVEKRVMKEEKKRRTDFSREDFVAKIQAFKDEYEATITNQLKKMGCSCDWDRQRFTMDEQCAAAVREAFFILFRDGLIYRGKRLVNWDPVLQTAVADDECYDEEIDGHFYYLRYPLVMRGAGAAQPGSRDEDAVAVTWGQLAARGFPAAQDHPSEQHAWITVATTRPETYLGDTAVAINPHDPRASSLRGLSVTLPLVGRVIPIIEDSYVVLPERYARSDEEKHDPKAKMATGFLKVTPAHDPNDYEIGQRHALQMINIFSPDGRISDKHGWTDVRDAQVFVGLPREKARPKVVEEFKARDLFEGSKPHRHSVKHSDRSKAIVEPYLSDQWYVKVTDPKMAKAANAVLGTPGVSPGRERRQTSVPGETPGLLEFFPERYAKTYEDWHNGIRDWCISRQLWWGHRIPVWTLQATSEECAHTGLNFIGQLWKRELPHVVTYTNNEHFPSLEHGGLREWQSLKTHVCLRREDVVLQAELEANGFQQDPDVLDTWFSSALWPLSTLGWPDPTKTWSDNPRSVQLNAGLLDAFNPSQVLCTAREIITLWVSRMVMFNGYLKDKGQLAASAGVQTPGTSAGSPPSAVASAPGQGGCGVPFHHVFIHAVIQDGEGRKMSKSLGNGVDPLDIIATHGADAMRFTLCHMATNTQDVRLPVKKDANGKNTSEKFDLGRNFATKLWNASRFALSMIAASQDGTAEDRAKAGKPLPPAAPTPLQPSLIDRWMLSRLASGFADVEHALASYEFHEYAQSLYDLLWRDFCDWYLEGIKPTVAQSPAQQAILGNSLSAIVRMLHPVMPYVTEVLWSKLRETALPPVTGVHLRHDAQTDDLLQRRVASGLLCHQPWPRIDASLRDNQAEVTFDRLRALVTSIRDVRATHQVKPSARIALQVPAQLATFLLSADIRPLLMTFAGLESVSERCQGSGSGEGVSFTFESGEFFIPGIGASKETEAGRVFKQIADLEKSVATLQARLNNPGYADRAPPAMVQQTRDELARKQGELEAARGALARLQ